MQVGTLIFDGLPTVASATNWYQLVVGGKTFDFYAATNASSGITGLAADGLASATSSTNAQAFTLQVVPGAMDSLDSATMVPYQSAAVIAALPQPTSPVAGTLASATFTAVQTGAGQGQATDVASSVYLTSGQSLAFGWTGTSTAANQVSWISAATNKIGSGDLAHVAVVDLATGLTAMSWNVAPDIDGQWTTPTAYAFTAGTYAVTMTEMLADGVTPYGRPSSPVYIVVSATGAIVDTAAHISGALDAYQAVNASLTSITVSDNNPLTVSWAQMSADAAALALTKNANASSATLNVVDSSTTILANLNALNGKSQVVGIGFTDPGTPTLDLLYSQFTTDSTAIGEMMGPRTLVVTAVTGQPYGSFEQDYRHGVLASGANGSGVLALTRDFFSNYSSGAITSARPTSRTWIRWAARRATSIPTSPSRPRRRRTRPAARRPSPPSPTPMPTGPPTPPSRISSMPRRARAARRASRTGSTSTAIRRC